MPVLYLSPALLSENTISQVLPPHVVTVIHGLRQFIVEDIRTARRFLSKTGHPGPIDQLQFRELNEHTAESEVASFLSYLQTAHTGVISEAGVPGVADPGAAVVRLAHVHGIKVVPLVGPSSILMALMASGLNGQSFAFVGYLPVKQNERRERLRILERRSSAERQTQIFIETPYRNMQLLDDILKCCRPETMLTIAADITGSDEYILTQSIRQWKNKLPELNKIPAVFLLQA
ncbi:MAG: SAM-dependent methyltransferase [Dysgonamonadaceae bacterium]|jgi:16S rRNA (cytidine1402-2'-O)-methyltransferase|nr:SAM-dependent methyltransferase [Dysgonamonadaceae bacterium]